MGRLSAFFLLPAAFRWPIDLRLTPMDQGDIGLNEELATRKSATLGKSGLGPFGPGDGDPGVALFLGERAPTFGDRGENSADRALRRAAGVVRDKRRIGVLAKPIALPDSVPAFA